jgi:hypothetical protein
MACVPAALVGGVVVEFVVDMIVDSHVVAFGVNTSVDSFDLNEDDSARAVVEDGCHPLATDTCEFP